MEHNKLLYRKISKTTHNGVANANYGSNPRYKYDRHTKKGRDYEESGKQISRLSKSKRGGKLTQYAVYDYTPLYKYLLKCEGKVWSDVWDDIIHRINDCSVVKNMVANINDSGLVCNNVDIMEKCFRYGEGTRFSKMYVDDNGILQFVDKNYIPSPVYEHERKWGETFNGELYETYKQSYDKYKKKLSHMKAS